MNYTLEALKIWLKGQIEYELSEAKHHTAEGYIAQGALRAYQAVDRFITEEEKQSPSDFIN